MGQQSSNVKRKILTFNGVYLPGYKFGGPIRSIANMAQYLKNDLEFMVIASDRDFGDKHPFNGVKVDDWNKLNNEKVFYHKGMNLSIIKMRSILNNTDYDIVYLNGYYASYTRKYLILQQLRLIKRRPTIICPRGDFSEGASNTILKKVKKQAYIVLLKSVNFNKGLIWHATSAKERHDTQKVLGLKATDIIEAENIPTNRITDEFEVQEKIKGSIKLVFISRIARKKNLLFALRLLKNLHGSIVFNIYGPIFDQEYWEECKKEIENLPLNVRVNYCGSISGEKVFEVFSNHHFFLFPTFGENYGHAIFESLSSGCPVIISDQTPWSNLEEKGIGWDIPLNDQKKFIEILQYCLNMTNEQYKVLVNKSRNFATGKINNSEEIMKTSNLFNSVSINQPSTIL